MKTKKMYLTPRLKSTEMMMAQIVAGSAWLEPRDAKKHEKDALWYNDGNEGTSPASEKNGLEW